MRRGLDAILFVSRCGATNELRDELDELEGVP
jgi:hypothetical protein